MDALGWKQMNSRNPSLADKVWAFIEQRLNVRYAALAGLGAVPVLLFGVPVVNAGLGLCAGC